MNPNIAEQYLDEERVDHRLPKVEIPTYKVGEHGDWSIKLNNPRNLIKGYFNGMQAPDAPNYVLYNRDDGTVWMSLTPMEIESHAYHVAWATGKVVIGGLGLGMYLYNVMRKKDVTEVVVVEHNEDIVKHFHEFIADDVWAKDWEPYWHKVTIVTGDIKDMTCDTMTNADYLYVDIWPLMFDSKCLEDMEVICGNLKPKMSGWWCQEGDYVDKIVIARRLGIEPECHTTYAQTMILEHHGIPTCGSRLPNGNSMLIAVVTQIAN